MPILGSSLYTNTYGKSQPPPFTPIASIQGAQDGFIVRYSLDGKALWSARIGTTGVDVAYSITTSPGGDVYLTGYAGSGLRLTAYNADGTEFGVIQNAGNLDVFLVKYSGSGVGQWMARIASTGADIGYSVATDINNDVIVVGQAGSSVVTTAYNADGTAFGTTFTSSGLDVFVAKYNSAGVVQFLTRIGSSASDVAFSVATDSSRAIIVTGQGGSAVTITAYNANGTAYATTLTNVGGNDAFLVRYTPIGNVLWVAKIASTLIDVLNGVATDLSDNIYVIGQGGVSQSTTFYQSNNNTTTNSITVTNIGANDTILGKYDSGGNVVWATKIANAGTDTGYGVATDSSSNVYVSASGTGPAAITAYNADGTAFSPTIANAGFLDAILVKYNTSGFVQWAARVATSTGNDTPISIGVDSSDNVYMAVYIVTAGPITGYNSDATAFGTQLANIGGSDSCIVKYNPSGFIQWMRRIASGGTDIIRSITLGKNKDLYTVGTFGGGYYAMYGQSNSVFSIVPNTGTLTDGLVVKYNRNGEPQWVASIVSSGDDVAYGVTSDSVGNLYVTGNTGTGTTSFYNADNTLTSGTTITPSGNDVYLAKYNTNGIVQWTASLTSPNTDIGYSTATDSIGNVYITGSFTETLTPKNSDGTSFGTTITSGTIDVFLVKYNSAGFVQWIARMGGSDTETGYSVCTDLNNNVYVAGSWTNTGASFQAFNSNGTGGPILPQLSLTGTTDAFVVKYNSSGTSQWMAAIASINSDIAYSVSSDSSGNVYVVGAGSIGQSSNTVTAYNQGFSGTAFGSLTNAGLGDVFIVKYNTSGAVQWLTRVASAAADVGRSGCTDTNGNLYVLLTGASASIIPYNADTTAFSTLTISGGLAEAYIVKYNSAGRVQWVTAITSASAEAAFGIQTDKRGNIYVVGQFGPAAASAIVYNSDGTQFANIIESCSIVKFDTNGFGLWAQTIRGTTTGVPLRGVSVDQFDNVYVGGNTQSGQTTTVYSSDYTPYKLLIGKTGTQDSFVAKYSQQAEPQWIAKVTSLGTTTEFAYGVSTDSSRNCYISGVYAGNATVWNADGTEFGTLLNSGNTDIFLVKYKTTGVVEWATRIVNTSDTDVSFDVTVDSSNNIYVIGHSNPGNIIPYNSGGTPFTTLVTGGTAATSDAYIVKYNSSGTVQWTALMSSVANDLVYAVTTDSSGNVYVCGSFSGATLTAYNSNGTAFATTVALTGAPDTFLAKYNSAGFVQWIASVRSGSNTENPFGVATDSIGNVYMTFQTIGTVTAYNADGSAASIPTLGSSGNVEGMIIKYNSVGTAQWMAKIGSTASDTLRGVHTDATGNVYVTGTFSGTANVCNAGDGTSIFGTLTASSGADIPVIKYNTNGLVQWAARISSSGNEVGYAIKCDSAGDVYIAGSIAGAGVTSVYNANGTLSLSTNFSFTGTGGNTFLVKYNSSGVAQWISSLVGPGTDEARGLAIDSSNNIYLAGMFTTSALVPEST